MCGGIYTLFSFVCTHCLRCYAIAERAILQTDGQAGAVGSVQTRVWRYIISFKVRWYTPVGTLRIRKCFPTATNAHVRVKCLVCVTASIVVFASTAHLRYIPLVPVDTVQLWKHRHMKVDLQGTCNYLFKPAVVT